jgi:hypothetical protein
MWVVLVCIHRAPPNPALCHLSAANNRPICEASIGVVYGLNSPSTSV